VFGLEFRVEVVQAFLTVMMYLKCGRQVDELQAFVDQLKEEVMAHHNNPRLLMVDVLETEKAKHLEVIAQLQSQLEQVWCD
jgi:EAL domain-containing protein (putative c-di-GMP-specific phosphodiesterase class I)